MTIGNVSVRLRAPEGATHYEALPDGGVHWIKFEDGKVYSWSRWASHMDPQWWPIAPGDSYMRIQRD